MIGYILIDPVYTAEADGTPIDWIDPIGYRFMFKVGKMSRLSSCRVYKTMDGAEFAALQFLKLLPHLDWEY